MVAKTQVQVPIPPPLQEFFRELLTKIQAREFETIRESDDLIQSQAAEGGPCTIFGGVADAQAGRFGFTYFPTDDDQVTWEFLIARQEIEQIAAGKKDHLDLWKCGNANCKSLHATKESYCSWDDA